MDHSSVIYLMAPDGSYLTHFTHASTAENIAKALAERVDPAQAAGAGSSSRPRSKIGDTPAAFRVEEVQLAGIAAQHQILPFAHAGAPGQGPVPGPAVARTGDRMRACGEKW